MAWPSKQRILKECKSWLGFAIFIIVFYFGNKVIQTRLGETAFESTGLPNLSLEHASQLARESNKLIVAELSALWCSTCRKFDHNVLSNTSVKQVLTENFVFSRIDSESPEAPLFMARYNARGYPTIMLLKPDGSPIKQIPLTMDPDVFLRNLSVTPR